MPAPLYLDHAATAPPLPEALDVFNDVAERHFANPGSLHGAGVSASAELRKWRGRLAKALGLDDWTVVITGSGTESDHLGVVGLAHSLGSESGGRSKVLIGAAEHSAVSDNALAMSDAGFTIESIPVDRFGIVRPEALEPLLGPEVVLVAVQWANNELGGVNPILALSKLIRQLSPKAAFHVDAVQAAGKIKLDLCVLGADSIAVAGHKIGGVRGCAALFLRPNGPRPIPTFCGGGHESGLRSATENISGLASFTTAAEIRRNYLREYPNRYHQTREQLLAIIKSARPNCIVLGPTTKSEVQGSILTVAFQGESAEPLLHRLDQAGIQCGSGSACSEHGATSSPILAAINLEKELHNSVLRFSFDGSEREEDLRRVAQVLANRD